ERVSSWVVGRFVNTVFGILIKNALSHGWVPSTNQIELQSDRGSFRKIDRKGNVAKISKWIMNINSRSKENTHAHALTTPVTPVRLV
ncbi:19971_t:CDS:1, partial [Racocetra persica]